MSLARFALVLIAGLLCLQPAHSAASQDPMTALAPVEVVADSFLDATGIAVDGHGNLFVADRAAGTVTRIAPGGTRAVVMTSLQKPVGLALDVQGRLLVAEEQAGRILRLELDGTVRVVATRLAQPRWLATDARGTIYVSASSRAEARDGSVEGQNDLVLATSPTGIVSVFARGLENIEGLASTHGMIFAGGRGGRGQSERDGVVYTIPILADGSGGTPQAYAAIENVKKPLGLSLDHVGATYMAAEKLQLGRDSVKAVITKLGADGTISVVAWNLDDSPQGLAFDAEANLYVTNGRGGCVLRLRAPAPPVLSVPQLTRERVITVSGTTEPGALVELYLDPSAAPLTQFADAGGAFAIDVTLMPNAENHLYVTATGAAGLGLTSMFAEAVVTHDDIAPALSFVQPAAGATVGGSVTVQAQASDSAGRVAAMSLAIDGAPLATTSSPALPAAASTASAVWDASTATDGAHTLVAVAVDEAGNVATVSQVILVANQHDPVLTVNATSVAPGAQVTVTLTNGLGGAWDWLALAETSAPDMSYLQWTYVGAGITTRTWTVTMPMTPGSYEFRLFLNGVFTRAATSPPVTVLAGVTPVPQLNALTPAKATAGGPSFTLQVDGANFIATSVIRWNGLDLPTTFSTGSQLRATVPAANFATAGTAQVTVFTPPPGGGTSQPLSFSIVPPPTLTVSATTATPGSSVTVTLTNGLGGALDWLALAPSTAPDTTYLQWTYVGASVTMRTWTVTMPTTPGAYEFRLFLNNGFTRAATSPAVTVAP